LSDAQLWAISDLLQVRLWDLLAFHLSPSFKSIATTLMGGIGLRRP